MQAGAANELGKIGFALGFGPVSGIQRETWRRCRVLGAPSAAAQLTHFSSTQPCNTRLKSRNGAADRRVAAVPHSSRAMNDAIELANEHAAQRRDPDALYAAFQLASADSHC